MSIITTLVAADKRRLERQILCVAAQQKTKGSPQLEDEGESKKILPSIVITKNLISSTQQKNDL